MLQPLTSAPGPDLAKRLSEASLISATEMVDLFMEVDAFKKDMLGFMRNYDAILCPPTALSPRTRTEGVKTHYHEWTYLSTFNLTCWPAIVLRAGTSRTGLPLGVQIVGRPFEVSVVLALARLVEKACGGYRRPDC